MEITEADGIIHENFLKIVEALELEKQSSFHSRTVFLDEASRIILVVRSFQTRLALKISCSGEKAPEFLKYASIPGHIERICEYMENMNAALRSRCAEGVRFSDKAVDEVDFLFRGLKEILLDTSGILVSKNPALAGDVKKAEVSFSESARQFIVRHRERVAEGICLPKAACLYFDLLDAFKAIAWHSKEITQELLG